MIKKKIIKKSNNNWLDSFKDGGPVDPTKPPVKPSLPSDYNQFLEYSKTAPENRRPDSDWEYNNPRQYDHYGMWDALGKPKNFNEALNNNPDWKPDENDGYYHGFSVNPNTGVWLKSHIPGENEPGNTAWMENLSFALMPGKYGPKENSLVYDPEIQRMRYLQKKKLAAGGVVGDPPVNPYAQGMNPLMPQTLVSDATAVKKQVLPTQNELQINKLNNAISNQPKSTISPMKKQFVPEKPSAWQQKMLQKQEEANTLGNSKVTFNQFGEPVLEQGMYGQQGYSAPASRKVNVDYMDPLTMGITMGAGAYGKGLSLADAALVGLDWGTYGTSNLGKSIGKWGAELVNGSIAAGKLKMPEFVTALRTEAAGFNPTTVTPHPSLNPTQQTFTGNWVQAASNKNSGAFDEMLAYLNGPERKQTGDMQLLSNVIPWSQAQKFAGKNLPFDAKTMSFGPGKYGTLENALKQKAINNREYVLLKNYNTRAEKIKQSTNLSSALDKTVSRLRKDPELYNPNEMLNSGLASSMRASPIAVGSSDIIATQIQNLKNSALTGHITTELQQGVKEMAKHTAVKKSVPKEDQSTEPQNKKRVRVKRIGFKNGGKLNNWLNNYK